MNLERVPYDQYPQFINARHNSGEINNEDVQHYRSEHPRDIGERLSQLVTAGWLQKDGHGRGTRYRWPITKEPDLLNTQEENTMSSEHLPPLSSEHLVSSSEHLPPLSSEHLVPGSEHLVPAKKKDVAPSGSAGEISESMDWEQEETLQRLAMAIRDKKKSSKPLMEKTVLAMSEVCWISLQTLARFLNRSPDSLRNHYINPMLRDGRLEARIPEKPNHPNQAYRKRQS